MIDTIPQLAGYDESALDAAFRTLLVEVREGAAALDTLEAREGFRLHWLGRKAGRLKMVSDAWLKSAPAESRRALGMRFNELKTAIEQALEAPVVPVSVSAGAVGGLDLSLPGLVRAPGIPHPLVETTERVVRVFEQLGFSVSVGPEVETDFLNFEALNFPPNHPARDTQDTLVVARQAGKASRDRLLMRTHTSPVQIRSMLAAEPPLRIVIPGKVHRNDAADATHSPIFHQIEGLAVGPDVTFSDLKGDARSCDEVAFRRGREDAFFSELLSVHGAVGGRADLVHFLWGARGAGSASTPVGSSCWAVGWWIRRCLRRWRRSGSGWGSMRRRMRRGRCVDLRLGWVWSGLR